MEFTREFFKES